jgi:hypothetical protein
MDTAILGRACVDALRYVRASAERTSNAQDPLHAGCRGTWRYEPDGDPPTDYELGIDLRLRPDGTSDPTAGTPDRCDTATIPLESGLTLCVRRSASHVLGWDGVLNTRGVDVELRLILRMSPYASDDERFDRRVRPVLGGVATVLGDAILGRYVPGARVPTPSGSGG